MNAIDFLTKEHEKVRKTLTQIAQNNHYDETKRKMFDTLCSELLRHETMEHKVWYPHLKNNPGLTDEVKHLLSEEKSAEKAIRQFDNIKSTQEWQEKFNKFKKDVEHHAREEETELFPQVSRVLSQEELDKIGKQMHEFTQNYTIH